MERRDWGRAQRRNRRCAWNLRSLIGYSTGSGSPISIHTAHLRLRAGRAERFLQLPYGRLFREARASNMVKYDVDGQVISDPTRLGISKGGFCIHSAIHEALHAVCASCTPTRAGCYAVANYHAMGSCLSASTRSVPCGKWAIWTTAAHSKPRGEAEQRFPEHSAATSSALRNRLAAAGGGQVHQGSAFRACTGAGACRRWRRSQCRDRATGVVAPDEEHCRAWRVRSRIGDAVINREWNALCAHDLDDIAYFDE